MASLQQEPTGVFHIVIRIRGKRYKRSLSTKVESKAVARLEEIQESADLLKRGKIQLPENVSAIDYVLSNGDPAVAKTTSQSNIEPKCLTLEEAFNDFFDAIPNGNIEPETLKMLHIHKRHLLRILKPRFDIAKLTGQSLQYYVKQRAKETTQYFQDRTSGNSPTKNEGVRTLVTATTIRKEITTLGSLWRWASTIPIVSGAFPSRGLRYPKTTEKPPFQTWSEIKRQVDLGHLTSREVETLWDCLYLRKTEVDELLEYVKENQNHDFIYPMFAMAAFTGARRSEILRSQRSDFDFDQKVVTIRERKRVKGRNSTRRVPLTCSLNQIMTQWFELHPGGLSTFAQLKSGRECAMPITRDQAQSHFRQTLKGSQWDRIKGWHCLRHSFISNLASSGIDQRIIDDFIGNTTEEMRRRYRHLFPDVKQAAIDKVFG